MGSKLLATCTTAGCECGTKIYRKNGVLYCKTAIYKESPVVRVSGAFIYNDRGEAFSAQSEVLKIAATALYMQTMQAGGPMPGIPDYQLGTRLRVYLAGSEFVGVLVAIRPGEDWANDLLVVKDQEGDAWDCNRWEVVEEE